MSMATKVTTMSTPRRTLTKRFRSIYLLEEMNMVRIGKTVMGFSAALVTLLVASVAHAQEVGVQYIERDKWVAIAAGLGLAIAAFGGALGQGRAAAAALEGISRNPNASDKLFTPMLLGLALIESLVIYSLIISFMLVFKIH